VIWNVVKNAVKFTSEGGWVRVSCEIAPPDRIRVTVADAGGDLLDAAAYQAHVEQS